MSSKRIRELEAALERTPDDERLLQQLGAAHQNASDDESAAEAFRRLAAVYARSGYLLKAVAALRQAAQLAPRRADIPLALAKLHVELELIDDAEEWFDAAHELAVRVGNAAIASEALTTHAQLSPDDVLIQLRFIESLLLENRHDEAATALKQVRATHTDFSSLELSLDSIRRAVLSVQQSDAVDAKLMKLSFARPN